MSDREIQALRRELAADPTDDAVRRRLVGAERRAGLHHGPLHAFGEALAALLRERQGEVVCSYSSVTHGSGARMHAPWSPLGPPPRVGMFVELLPDGTVRSRTADARAVARVVEVRHPRFDPLDPDGIGAFAAARGTESLRDLASTEARLLHERILRRVFGGINDTVGFGLSRDQTDPRIGGGS